MPSEFSFCETMTASGETPWHIRKLTDTGRHLGGNADTPTLCGRIVAWDLQVEITEHHLTHCCQNCAAIYRRET